MRTRTSVRNQNMLFHELFKPKDKPKPVRFASCFHCAHYPKGGRNHGTCSMRGERVSGLTMDQSCFQSRIVQHIKRTTP
jgi:hypothetical protein